MAKVRSSGTFESSAQNVYRSVVLRGAYRSYNEFFPSGEGFYVEARGRAWLFANVIGPMRCSRARISPWVLWSDISGTSSGP